MNQFKTLTINGNTYTVKDPHAAKIDDTVIGQQAWSSRKIIETLCPAFSKEDAVISCAPVAGYPLSITTQVAQEGEITLRHTGKNQFDGFWEKGRINTSTGENHSDNKSIRTGYIPIIPGQSYYFTAKKGTNNYPVFYDGEKAYTRYLGLKSGSFFFKVAENERYIRIAQFDETVGYSLSQLELGTQATTFEPYACNLYTKTMPAAGTYAWHTGIFTNADGEEQQVGEQLQIMPCEGTNVFYGSGATLAVSGRQDIAAILKNL